MKIGEIVETIREYPGIRRKRCIEEVSKSFPTLDFKQVIAAEGEDAAVIDNGGEEYILFATDGMMESLIRADPYRTGYFGVLVNVNDIAAMGGTPLAMVDVLAITDDKRRKELLRGMQDGVDKFGVPIVGGHTHPDCSYDAFDIAVIGTVPKDAVVRSDSALPGDDIVFVMDLEGVYPDTFQFAFDSTAGRDAETVRGQLRAAAEVGRRHLVHSGKDFSNCGCVGTACMMIETSGVGARIDVGRIPVPEGADLKRWLLAYIGSGFVYACDPACSQEVIDIFGKVGCAGAVVGKITEGHEVVLSCGGEEQVLFDFTKDVITGCLKIRK